MTPTQHRQELGLVSRSSDAGPDDELVPVRRPRGHSRGRRPDPALEVRFDPRLELAEQLLHRSLTRCEPLLLRQVGNLLEEARADQNNQNTPALLDLDELLLSMTQDESTFGAKRAKRIMEARRLLHRVDQEAADPRWPEQVRRRQLHRIIEALSAPPHRD